MNNDFLERKHGKYNCPNCGAPIEFSEKCKYCGTNIGWMPYELGTIKTIPFKAVPIKCQLSVNKYSDNYYHIPDEIIENQLKKEMSLKIADSVSIRQVDNFLMHRIDYIGEILVGKPEDSGKSTNLFERNKDNVQCEW